MACHSSNAQINVRFIRYFIIDLQMETPIVLDCTAGQTG